MSENPGKTYVSSTVDKLMAKAEERKSREELSKEEMADLKKAVNSILASKNGKLFWKMSRKMMKIDVIDQDFTPINMAVAKAYRNYYNVIMNMLEPSVRIELEQGK